MATDDYSYITTEDFQLHFLALVFKKYNQNLELGLGLAYGRFYRKILGVPLMPVISADYKSNNGFGIRMKLPATFKIYYKLLDKTAFGIKTNIKSGKYHLKNDYNSVLTNDFGQNPGNY